MIRKGAVKYRRYKNKRKKIGIDIDKAFRKFYLNAMRSSERLKIETEPSKKEFDGTLLNIEALNDRTRPV